MTLRINPRGIAVATFAVALVASALPALALEGTPQGQKLKDRHVFRDVQLGLSHPAPHGRSTQTSKPPAGLPWFFPLPSSWEITGSQGAPDAK